MFFVLKRICPVFVLALSLVLSAISTGFAADNYDADTYADTETGFPQPDFQFKSFPLCDDTKVLGKIVERFNRAEKDTWNRGFYLEDIQRVRERVVQSSRVSQIPRRYCRAHAQLTNGKHPTLYYLIEGGQGFAGTSFNVEFCLGGYDRWNEYDGSCRVLRY